MKTTGSSKLNKYYDRLRRQAVIAAPEETVRQKLIEVMVEQLGYPRELLVVEKSLSQLPHLFRQKGLPRRRADLLCFGKNIHKEHLLFPLLLVECKEGSLKLNAEQQVLGYNYFVQAPYVALANQEGPKLIFPKKLDYLPPFFELISQL